MSSVVLINEFCDLYHVDKGEVDYWTRIGLLHPRIMKNGYRSFESIAEEEIQFILIARMIDYPGSLDSKIDRIKEMNNKDLKSLLGRLKNDYDNYTKDYEIAYSFLARKSEGR